MGERELFRYMPGNDPVRNFDSRLKLPLFLAAAVSAAALQPLFLLLLLPLPAAAAKSTSVNVKTVIREGRIFLFIALLLFLSTAFFSEYGGMAAVMQAGVKAARFLLVVFLSHIMIETSSTREIGNAVHSWLHPFSKPFAEKSALSIMLTIRFIPMLFDTLDDINDARQARSIKSCRSPLRRMYTLFIPLFSVMLEHSEEMIEALETRGVGRDGRMSIPPSPPVKRKQLLFFSLIFGYLALLLIVSLIF
jgi:biotin transport system permease protein